MIAIVCAGALWGATIVHEETKKHEEHEIASYTIAVRDFRGSSVLRDDPSLTLMQPSAPRTIEKGEQSNIDDPKQVLVRTDAEWAALWRQHARDRPRPQIDFSKESIVAVFMGSRPNAGFSTAIVSATEGGGALIVRYTETKPSADAVSAQVLTFPFHIVAIPKVTAANVKFEKIQ